MAVDASWPIPETANSAAGTGCRLSHGGVWCGDCRRARNGRYALSADHGTQYASTHGYMGRAAIDRLCTPQEGAAGTYTPIGRAPGRYSQNRCVICEAASNTSRKKHSARSRSHVSTSLRGALATKQSILRLLHSRRPMDCFACSRKDGVETSVLEPKAAAQWIPRRSLSSSSAKGGPEARRLTERQPRGSFAIGAFPLRSKTLYGAASLCHRQM